MTQKAKIISDGTPQGTKVYIDGVEVKGIVRLEISPIRFGELVTAKLTLHKVELDLVAEVGE